MATVEYDDILLKFSSSVNTRGISTTINALEKLKDINGFSGLKQAGQDLQDFINVLNGLSSGKMKTITEFAKAIKGVGGIGRAMKAVSNVAEKSNPLNDTSMSTANAPSVDLASKLNEGDATQMWNDIANAIDGAITESAKFGFSIGEDLDIMLGVGRDVVGVFSEMGDAIKTAMEKAKKAVQKVVDSIGSLLGRFASLVRYRIMRAIISGFVNGIKEGFSNLEAWDRRVGMTGFAESMDRARESLLVLKNSLAVITAPALEFLIGVLQKVATWAMTASNAISRFFAILGGKSTYRAVIWADTLAESEAKAGGSAKKATAEFKKQLMAFDEINNITEQNGGGSGGGGGSGSGAKYTEMFEERDVGEMSDIEKKLKQVWDWIKKIGESLTPVWEKLKQMGAPLEKIWESVKNIVSIVGGWIKQIVAPAWGSFVQVLVSIANLLVSVADAVAKVFDSIVKLLVPIDNATNKLNVWQGASLVLQGTLLSLKAVIDVISGVISTVAYVVQVFTARMVYLGDIIGNLYNLISGKSSWEEFKKNMADAETKMNNTVTKATNDLYNALDRTFNRKWYVKTVWDEIINRTVHVNEIYTAIGSNGMRTVEKYASGGIVPQGQLFIAREAGAEMVGQIGGHTAVANNQDIVASVSQGVASAVASVLGGGSNVTVTLEGDAKGIFKVVQKEGRAYSARTGQPALA